MQLTDSRASIYSLCGVLHRMRQLPTPLTFSLLVMRSPYWTLRWQDLMPALQPPMLLPLKVSFFPCRCTKVVTHEVHPKVCYAPRMHAFPLLCAPVVAQRPACL